MPARDYRDLIAWKRSFELAVALYRETSNFPTEEKYGLTSQLRRAGISIPSNIAEGEGRPSREFRRYLCIALGSLKELETQILISDELGACPARTIDCAFEDGRRSWTPDTWLIQSSKRPLIPNID